jgi:hypothetical protein
MDHDEEFEEQQPQLWQRANSGRSFVPIQVKVLNNVRTITCRERKIGAFEVRLANRAMEAKTASADSTHWKGFGLSL